MLTEERSVAQARAVTDERTEPANTRPYPGNNALQPAAALWQEVAKNEETRFNNLNTRAVGVLSVTALVTSIAGFFTKDLLSTTVLRGWIRGIAAGLLAASVALLAVAAFIVVVAVLWPRRRAVFGGNTLETDPASFQCPEDVQKLAIDEYSQIAATLQVRNSRKAAWLRWAYCVVMVAVASISSAAILFAGNALWSEKKPSSTPGSNKGAMSSVPARRVTG